MIITSHFIYTLAKITLLKIKDILQYVSYIESVCLLKPVQTTGNKNQPEPVCNWNRDAIRKKYFFVPQIFEL